VGVTLLAAGILLVVRHTTWFGGGNPVPTASHAGQVPSPAAGRLPDTEIGSLLGRPANDVVRQLRNEGYTVITGYPPSATGTPGTVIDVAQEDNGRVRVTATPPDPAHVTRSTGPQPSRTR
jgi:hypothetical protein